MKHHRQTEKRNPDLEPLLLNPRKLNLVLGVARKEVVEHKSSYRFDWRWYGIAALLSIFCALAAPPNPIAWVGLLGGWISVLININVVLRMFRRA
jgi:hypothetical protein